MCVQVVQQCVATEGVEAEYVKTEVLPEFFRAFWQRRMALDRRNYRALVETTVSLANRVGVAGAASCLDSLDVQSLAVISLQCMLGGICRC